MFNSKAAMMVGAALGAMSNLGAVTSANTVGNHSPVTDPYQGHGGKSKPNQGRSMGLPKGYHRAHYIKGRTQVINHRP